MVKNNTLIEENSVRGEKTHHGKDFIVLEAQILDTLILLHFIYRLFVFIRLYNKTHFSFICILSKLTFLKIRLFFIM